MENPTKKVLIDNWPHPPIVLSWTPPPPRRICGVFVHSISPGEDRVLRGQYFSSTAKASAELGYKTDKLGRLLRMRRGPHKRRECAAILDDVCFMKAEDADDSPALKGFFRSQFPWMFEHRDQATRDAERLSNAV